ncbi:MAG: radical SAM protein [Candidatus Peribacteria bacterium]|nr:radical SAM protein [Candidatus Peribacteria bacterium]
MLLNTCGFISSGRDEAIATAKKLLKKGKQVCITGCAVKYRKELAHEPARDQIKSQVDIYPRNELNTIFLSNTPRALTNLPHKFEYLKIAEGCNNSCSFCIIPKIRGKQTSLPIPQLLHEVQTLVYQGAEEIILIAQDSTRYGTDLYGKPQLFELLEQIEQLP